MTSYDKAYGVVAISARGQKGGKTHIHVCAWPTHYLQKTTRYYCVISIPVLEQPDAES